jgi:hypothetical protein
VDISPADYWGSVSNQTVYVILLLALLAKNNAHSNGIVLAVMLVVTPSSIVILLTVERNPKSKDFAEIVKGLAVEAGVSLQKANPREYVPIPGSGTKFRVQRRNLDELVKLFQRLKHSSGQNWLKSREFTADVTVNSEYYYHEPPTEGKGHLVRSGLGLEVLLR